LLHPFGVRNDAGFTITTQPEWKGDDSGYGAAAFGIKAAASCFFIQNKESKGLLKRKGFLKVRIWPCTEGIINGILKMPIESKPFLRYNFSLDKRLHFVYT
jgi:hypothetical protein